MNKLFALASALMLTIPGAANGSPIVRLDSLMVSVPNFGPSRYETVNFCLNDAGVDKYQDLMTDTEVETFESCMVENT